MLIQGQNHLNNENLNNDPGVNLTRQARERRLPLLATDIPPAVADKLKTFLFAFFTGTPLNDQLLDQFIECLQISPGLDMVVLGSPARTAYPAKRRSQLDLCKRLIEKVLIGRIKNYFYLLTFVKDPGPCRESGPYLIFMRKIFYQKMKGTSP